MFDINLRKQRSHQDPFEDDFPSIDFKFQNIGNATAFLWKFAVNMIQAEVDVTPALDFEAKVNNNVLKVEAVNRGWGTAHNCLIQVNEVEHQDLILSLEEGVKITRDPHGWSQAINRLFPESLRCFSGTIQSGESKKMFCLESRLANPDQWKSINQEFRDLNASLRAKFPDKQPLIGVKIGDLSAKWSCVDDKGTQHQGTSRVRLSYYGDLLLTSDGFFENPDTVVGTMMGSIVTYVSMIDPLEGPHEQMYPFSHKIPPGDVERFHIIIGSPISCHLLIQFRFFVDKATVIESEIFDIHIWNPRPSLPRFHAYEDGEELNRELNRLKHSADTNKFWSQEYLDFLQREASIYPFRKIEKG